jgi:hypothetical protein
VRWQRAFIPVMGACCLADGTCLNMYDPDCREQRGTWHGPNSRCENMDCKPCPSDIDSSGAVDIDDIRILIECIELGGCRDGVNGDVNRDGNIDDADIVHMIDAMLSGVC